MSESNTPAVGGTPSDGQGGKMRSSFDWRLVWGLGLIALGALLLLQNLEILQGTGVLWGALFGAAGIAFLAGVVQDRSRWWLVIPGVTLLGLGATIVVGDLLPAPWAGLGGSVFLGSIGLSFLVVYVLRPDQWWAIIPAGTLGTLAIVAGIGDRVAGIDSGAVLFLGLAATFLILALLPEGRGRQSWAIFPAAGLGIVGLLIGAAFGTAARILWPVALILLGLVFIFRTARARRG